jgi:hypothetical protein
MIHTRTSLEILMYASKFRLAALSAALSILFVLPLAAHADSFTTGNTTGSTMNFTYKGSSESASGGNFAGSTGVVNGVSTSFLDVFCIDLSDNISLNSSYNATYTNTGVANGSTVANASKIAWLVLNLGTSANTSVLASALQAAIWETEYGSAFTLSNNNSSALLTAYNQDLAALGSNTASVSSLLWMTAKNGNGYYQAQVIAPVSPVPEPGTLSLLGTGVLTLAGLVRRRANRMSAANQIA